MASMADTMPELVLVAETDAAAARRARRLAAQGTLLRLACSDGPRPLITRYYGRNCANPLARCNAFQEDLRNYKLLFPPAKPKALTMGA